MADQSNTIIKVAELVNNLQDSIYNTRWPVKEMTETPSFLPEIIKGGIFQEKGSRMNPKLADHIERFYQSPPHQGPQRTEILGIILLKTRFYRTVFAG